MGDSAGQAGPRRGGQGEVVVEVVGGSSVATKFVSSYPLKLMQPCKRGIRSSVQASLAPPSSGGSREQGSGESRQGKGQGQAGGQGAGAAVLYVVTYGGGILGGDCIRLRCTVGPGAAAVLTTQSSTKVYKCAPAPSPPAEQHLWASVGTASLLALLPDPVTCFARARFRQEQTFCVAPGGSLALVDWVTSGRRAMGEEWDLSLFSVGNRVYWGGRLLMLEQLRLSESGLLQAPLRVQLEGLHALGLLVLLGPRTESLQRRLQALAEEMMQAQVARSRSPSGGLGASAPPLAPARVPAGTGWCDQPVPGSGSGADGAARGRSRDPELWLSCSPLEAPSNGERGLLLRFASASTESVYRFLQEALAPLSIELGWTPYAYFGS